jgi:tetratricopeptide (TPR) repeat protein
LDRLKIVAKSLFKQRRYQDAMKKFESILSISPYDIEAKLGFLLCDMAQQRESDAKTLFEFYEESKKSNADDANALLDDLLKDDTVNLSDEIWSFDKLYRSDELKDYVEYRDFLALVESRGEFKRAFEDMIFSTKIVIDSKEDFIEFISKLLENGYTNTALNYLESAISLYPHEDFFQKTLGKLEV